MSIIKKHPKPYFASKLGKLYNGDCIDLLDNVSNASVDLIFADPPFNLSKKYGSRFSDNRTEKKYLSWTYQWLDKCVLKLKPGGSMFVFNIPKWSIHTAHHLMSKLSFRHWIAVDLTLSMPINRRLYPSHYSLLYFVKGEKANVFNPPRLPIEICRGCGLEQHDYGGHKGKMNPLGVNLRDIWTDVPPVRHTSRKHRFANQLSVKLVDRILDIATNEGDLVLDPFGGSGTTYAVSELKKRRWIGMELIGCSRIRRRLKDLTGDRENLRRYRKGLNRLFSDKALLTRIRNGQPIHHYQIDDAQLERVFDLVRSPKTIHPDLNS